MTTHSHTQLTLTEKVCILFAKEGGEMGYIERTETNLKIRIELLGWPEDTLETLEEAGGIKQRTIEGSGVYWERLKFRK